MKKTNLYTTPSIHVDGAFFAADAKEETRAKVIAIVRAIAVEGDRKAAWKKLDDIVKTSKNGTTTRTDGIMTKWSAAHVGKDAFSVPAEDWEDVSKQEALYKGLTPKEAATMAATMPRLLAIMEVQARELKPAELPKIGSPDRIRANAFAAKSTKSVELTDAFTAADLEEAQKSIIPAVEKHFNGGGEYGAIKDSLRKIYRKAFSEHTPLFAGTSPSKQGITDTFCIHFCSQFSKAVNEEGKHGYTIDKDAFKSILTEALFILMDNAAERERKRNNKPHTTQAEAKKRKPAPVDTSKQEAAEAQAKAAEREAIAAAVHVEAAKLKNKSK